MADIAWVKRKLAPAVPGVEEFIKTVRAIPGSRVAWITDTDGSSDPALDLTDATRANLAIAQLWDASDLLCIRRGNRKRDRRQELAAGKGTCSWPNTPIQVQAFIGDQMGDFPDPDEPNWAKDAFGVRFFLLPNPMYGNWVSNVTRPE
jgi:predicted secreted acid phosphatase